MKYKLVIFDWDGTLMDSAPRIVSAMQKAGELVGVDKPSFDEAKDIIGLSLPVAVNQLYGELDATTQADIVAHYRTQFVHHDTTPTPMFEGAAPLLATLKQRGCLLAVATGKSSAGLARALAVSETAQYFTCLRSGDDAQSKPAPDMLLQILAQLDIEPQQALMIGDTEYDMAMAQAAGIDRVGVSFGVHSNERLEQFAPLAIVDSLAEIESLVF